MFKPTVALLLDYGLAQMWDTGATGYLQASEQVAKTWFRVANVSCTLGFISDAVSDARRLQSIIDIKPLDICDYDFECKATASEVEMPEAHRPMLLFAQLLEMESTACVEVAARTDLAGINLPENVKCDGVAVRLQLLTYHGPRIMVNKCIDQFMQHSNGGTHQHQHQQQQHQQQNLSRRGLMLRSSTMLLKLASLVINVQSSRSMYLSQTINCVITLLTRALHQATASSSGKQEHQLAVLAVKLVMSMLKYHVKQGCNEATTTALLEFLDCVVEGEPDGTVQPLLAQLLASGTVLCPNIVCMQTETHHLSDPAPDLLELPLSAQYLLMEGAKHGRIETKRQCHLKLLLHTLEFCLMVVCASHFMMSHTCHWCHKDCIAWCLCKRVKISYTYSRQCPRLLLQRKPDEAAVHRRHGSACDHA